MKCEPKRRIKLFNENQIVLVKWNSKIKNHYVNKGYMFTKMGDVFEVKAKDLTKGSNIEVICRCDYCKKEYKLQYKLYLHSIKTGLLACNNCQKFKHLNTIKKKYGVDNMSQIDFVKEKKRQKSLERYGTDYSLQAKEVRELAKRTMFEKYGVYYPLQSDEIMSKITHSFFRNGTTPTSKPERKLCDILSTLYGKENCVHSYPLDRVNFDCLLKFKNNLIDVEYDGNYYHKNRENYDNKRNGYVMKHGYKILRIKGDKNDNLPTENIIKKAVDYLVHNHSIIYIDMNKQDEDIVCTYMKV